MDFTLLNLQNVLRDLGRGVVFSSAYWDGTADLALTHLGDTEGAIKLTQNEEYTHLTLPELTGSAKHRSYVAGKDPVLEIPFYSADPALRAVLSPTGTASGGYSRRRPVLERTLVVFPEELFYDATADEYGALSYVTGTGWQIGGAALSTRQQALLGQALWIWRGFFMSPDMAYQHDNGGKDVESVKFQAMHDATKPDGHQLYTLGDPSAAAIVIDVA